MSTGNSDNDVFETAVENPIEPAAADYQQLIEYFETLIDDPKWKDVAMKDNIKASFDASKATASIQDQLARARVELAQVYEASGDVDSLRNAYDILLQDEKWSADDGKWSEAYESGTTSASDMQKILAEVKTFLMRNDDSFKKAFARSNETGATQESSNAPITGGEYNPRDGDYNPRYVQGIQREWTELKARYQALNNDVFKNIIARSHTQLSDYEIEAFNECQKSYQNMISAKKDYNDYMSLNQQLAKLAKKKNKTQAEKDAKNQLDDRVKELKNKYKGSKKFEDAIRDISLEHQDCHRNIKQKLQDAPRILKNLRRLLDLSDRGVDVKTLEVAQKLLQEEDSLNRLLTKSKVNITDKIRKDIRRTHERIDDLRKEFNKRTRTDPRQIDMKNYELEISNLKNKLEKNKKRLENAKKADEDDDRPLSGKTKKKLDTATKAYEATKKSLADKEDELKELRESIGAGGLGLSAV